MTAPALPLPALPDASPVGSPRAFLSRPGRLERAIVFLTLFTYAWGTPPEWWSFATTGATESSVLTQLVFLGFFGHTVIALNGNWHVVLEAMKREPLVPILIGLGLASTAWSTLPATTLQDSIVIAITYLTALHLVVRFTLEETITMLAYIFAVGALLNLGFVAAYEGIGDVSIATAGGDNWSGVTSNRNTLGKLAVLGYLTSVIQSRRTHSWFVWPFFAAINVLLVVGTNSATSLGALFGVSALGLVFLGFRGRKTLYGATAVAMGAVFSVLTILAATDLASFTGLLGRDSSFTGRLPIWQDSFRFAISERPFLGYGHSGFWRHGFVDFEVQLRTNNFDVPHAHNAWVDALLEVGPLGALFLTAIFARGLLWSSRNVRASRTAIGMFPALVVSLGVIYSTTESGFINRTIQCIMFVVALTTAAEHKGKKQPYAPDARATTDVPSDGLVPR